MQFRFIVVTDPQTQPYPPTNTHTNKPTDRTDYNTLRRSLARSIKITKIRYNVLTKRQTGRQAKTPCKTLLGKGKYAFLSSYFAIRISATYSRISQRSLPDEPSKYQNN